MTTFLTRIATTSFTVLLTVTAVTQVPAQQRVPAIMYRQPQVGVEYVVRELSDGGSYLKVTGVNPESPARQAGLQVGDWISKVGTRRVRSQRSFDNAVNGATGRTWFRVYDQNRQKWIWITLEFGSVGPPENPGGNGPNAELTGIWQSSGGGTVHFHGGNPNQIHAESNVPWVGPSDLVVTPNGNGSYNFTYQQRGSFQDSGHGKLTPRDGNTIDGYLVNRLGIRAEFVLTR
ncbi:MAG: PDZ domain-containing protein [Fuerstiella sp.]|nr:PDZ domain-containing protein [Fuerstiella sp.]